MTFNKNADVSIKSWEIIDNHLFVFFMEPINHLIFNKNRHNKKNDRNADTYPIDSRHWIVENWSHYLLVTEEQEDFQVGFPSQ